MAAGFIPFEFLIFSLFETQKADILAALAIFPSIALMALIDHYFMHNLLVIAVIAMILLLNGVCFQVCVNRYKHS